MYAHCFINEGDQQNNVEKLSISLSSQFFISCFSNHFYSCKTQL